MTDNLQRIFDALNRHEWFLNPGAWTLIDGQYGSTGKGLIAGALAEMYAPHVHVVLSNAGPNSGHTSYFGGKKIVLKQLPTFSVIAQKMGFTPYSYLSAGAVIDPELLDKERNEHGVHPFIHRSAAVIKPSDKVFEQENQVAKIASTGQGVGAAIVNKIRRHEDAVVRSHMPNSPDPWSSRVLKSRVCFIEVSQGFSLGINSGMYPYVTSRECTVAQALSDAGLPPSFHRGTIGSFRTFPIRVGNTETGWSGPCYNDQTETTWEALGQEPETTTVTGRIRRVFTWSDLQFMDAIWANSVDVVFLNFCNYLEVGEDDTFVRRHVLEPYYRVFKKEPQAIILGYGPEAKNLHLWGPK